MLITKGDVSIQRSQNLSLERLRENKHQNKQKQKFFSEYDKWRETETEILTTDKDFMKTHIVQQTKQQLRHDINGKIIFELKKLDGTSQGWE